MKTIDHQSYVALREGAEVLEVDHCGEKVLRLQDGTYLKIFRRKRFLSSALWYPYAQRFADNARALEALGIPVPKIIDVARIPSIARDIVRYLPLPGQSLRQILQDGLDVVSLRSLKTQHDEFVNLLFMQGVYFRSFHLGNVILTPDGNLGLIDFADLKIYRSPLGAIMRGRSLRRMARFGVESEWSKALENAPLSG